jgi:hypothetical protein
MAATSLEAIRRITIEAQEKGLADVAAKLDKIAKAQDGVVASSTSVEKSSGSVEQAFKRTERSLDSNVVAYNRYASAVKAVSDAQAQGLVSQQRSAELISLAETRLNKATAGMQQFGKATSAALAGPARHEMINFSAQVQDIGVSLIGGQSPFTVMAQQVPQIASVVGASNASLKDFVMTAVTGAGRFLAAWAPIAAVVGAVGTSAAAAMHALEQEREARIATTSGRGRLLGASAIDVGLAAERSQASGMSLGESRGGILEGVRAGVPTLRMIEQLNAVSKQYAATIGSDLVPAQKELMAAFADPVRGADLLDQKFKMLSPTTKDLIRDLQASGNTAGAAQVLFQQLGGVLASQADSATLAERAWSGLVTQLQRGAEVLGRIATMQQPGGTTDAGKRASEQASAISNKAGFATAIPGETSRTAVGATPGGPTQEEVSSWVQAAEAARQYDLAQAKITDTIAKAATAFQLQKDVMMATTVEQRAAATQAQMLNQLTEQGVEIRTREAAAEQAGNMVRQQSLATQQQKIAAQQAELAMSQQMVDAQNVLGAAGDALRAGLQMELSLRQQGIDVTTAHSQAMIANAEATARYATAAKDAAQAAQIGGDLSGKLESIQLEISLVGKSAEEHAKLTTAMQYELQARQAENQGLTEAAAQYRAYGAAIAEATAKKVQAEAADKAKDKSLAEDANDREALAKLWTKMVAEWQQQLDAYAAVERAQAQLKQTLQSTLDTVNLEISLVGASSAAHAYHTTLLQYENQAKQAEIQGNQEAADSYRRYGRAIASANSELAQRKEALQEAQAAEAAAAAADQARVAKSEQKSQAFKAQTFTSDMPMLFEQWFAANEKQNKLDQDLRKQMQDTQKGAQQKQMQFASSIIQDQITALQDQKTALDDNTSAIESSTTKRKAQLDKEISKLEKALNPSRPDPYAERNPDYFYRFGTSAFKENDPMQQLLAAAEAERDGLDVQVEQQKKSVELQQKAIDEQIKGYEAQIKQLDRANNLLSNGVDLSEQEIAGIRGIITAIAGLGDYMRLQTANMAQTQEATGKLADAYDPTSEFAGLTKLSETLTRGTPGQPTSPGLVGTGTKISQYGYEKGVGGFAGFFASGGYIPPGSWGIAGESGPEVIDSRRKIAGPATVTPINAGRPIVVNQTIVSQGGVRELRASRGEIAQRSSSEMRRSLGAR